MPHRSEAGPSLRLVCINDVYLLEHLPRIASLVRGLEQRSPVDRCLTTLAGDFLAPSLLSSIDHGRGMVRCLNALPVTHVCFGNHDDDVGAGELLERVAEFRGTWLNSNLPDFEVDLPAYEIVEVSAPGGRTVRVGLVGVVTDCPNLYARPPFGGGRIEPPNDAVCRLGRMLIEELGCVCVIPLTHQSLASDRALLARPDAPPIPVLVGGHEHEVHLQQVGRSHLVKAGSDAVHAAVVELRWPAEAPPHGPDLPSVTVRLEAAAEHPDDPSLRALADDILEILADLEAAALMPLPPGVELSSVGTRFRQTSMGTMVASRLRDALGGDACVLNGGGIRGDRSYRERFTYGDLKTELPFANEAVVLPMPGRVLAEVIAASRAVVPTGAFLQVDDRVEVDEGHRLLRVAGAPLQPDRLYRVVLIRALLAGIDGIAPLTRYVAEHPERLPEPDAGREVKLVLLESFSESLWRQLGDFEALDRDGDGRVDLHELAAAVAGLLGEPGSPITVELLMRAADASGEERLTAEEVAAAAGRG